MEPNGTEFPPFFYMESLDIPPSKTYIVVILMTLTYCVIVASNMTIILSIMFSRRLHKPMHLLLLNLPVNDLMGSTAFFPQLIHSIAQEDRSISYSACFFQGLLAHLYAGGAYIVLTTMALDRFLAICLPLRYDGMMSHANLLKMILAMWLLDIVLISVLFSLIARFRFCGTAITDMYCNNSSLVKLLCGDTTVNNYYGAFISALLLGVSLVVVVFTYVQILLACITNKQSDTKSKALRTCCTHLMVYLVFQATTILTVLSHRFSQVSLYLRRVIGVSIIVFPPILNPLIYGLNTKEIRSVVIHFFSKKKTPSFKR